ncbi:MAG: hypothetical protein HS107_06990 [Thermoflexaceae bacterium]|nr:hypothetical protein [Thermoflexaceae bacterium]
MWTFLRRQSLYFLVGFIVSFVIYLFIKIGANDVLWGLAVGAGGGLVVSIAFFLLERKFPESGGVVGN